MLEMHLLKVIFGKNLVGNISTKALKKSTNLNEQLALFGANKEHN